MDNPAPAEELSAEKAAELFNRHQRLRARLRWLLPLGALLVGWAGVLLWAYPTRTPLAGYRYQQVGGQAGRPATWWVLAHRGGAAELLSSTDTSRGWQRHALDVDSAQAHALALDWGGRALLVGRGTVRIYDSLLRPVGPVQYLDSGRFGGRWVAADAIGKWAFILGDRNQAQQTSDGGATWAASTILPVLAGFRALVVRRVVVDSKNKTVYWAAREGFLPIEYEKPPSLQNTPPFVAWYRPLRAPLAWLGFDARGGLLALDQRGTWVSPDKVDSTSNRLGQALADVAFLPGALAAPLGISATQVVRGKLGQQLAALPSRAAATPPGAPAGSAATKAPPGVAAAAKKTGVAKQPAAVKPKRQPVKSVTKSPLKSKATDSKQSPVDKKEGFLAPAPTAQPSKGALPTKGSDDQPAGEQSPTQNPIQQIKGGKNPVPNSSPQQQQSLPTQAAPSGGKEPEKPASPPANKR